MLYMGIFGGPGGIRIMSLISSLICPSGVEFQMILMLEASSRVMDSWLSLMLLSSKKSF